MQKKWFSTILLALLFLGGCNSTSHIMTETPTVNYPTFMAVQTSTPVNTSTPQVASATPQDPPIISTEQPPLDLEAQSAILMDAMTGTVLYEKRAHQRMYPASTTKIMTALLALEYFHPDELIRVGEEANLTWASERLDAQKAGLYYGQELTMRELLYGLLLASGSDAAFTIAVNVARRESSEGLWDDDQAIAYFATLMNKQSVSIGAVETNFTNPDGFQDPNHYSTAYDLALITQHAMQDPLFREIVATTVYTTAESVTSAGGTYSRSWENTNRLIQPQDEQYYAPANGVKTGTTPEAGHCLVASAMVGNNLVIVVVLGSTQEGVWSDSVTLLDYAKEDPL